MADCQNNIERLAARDVLGSTIELTQVSFKLGTLVSLQATYLALVDAKELSKGQQTSCTKDT
jgi:hypothetical protein